MQNEKVVIITGGSSGIGRAAAIRFANQGDKVLITVDGGITRENIAEVARWGADIIVTGSAVFDGRAPLENARQMIEAIQ